MVRLPISCYALTNPFRRYYGSIGTSGGSFNVSIDDSIPQRLNTTGDLTLDQQLIWSNTGLGPGRHTITITLTRDDTNLFNELNLDFFRSVVNHTK